MFVASASAPAADKKAREFPEILSEGLIAIIIVEWVGVARHRWRIGCHGVGFGWSGAEDEGGYK